MNATLEPDASPAKREPDRTKRVHVCWPTAGIRCSNLSRWLKAISPASRPAPAVPSSKPIHVALGA